jgi:hypothetical protein
MTTRDIITTIKLPSIYDYIDWHQDIHLMIDGVHRAMLLGCDINARNEFKWTVLDYALHHDPARYERFIDVLILYGAKCGTRNRRRRINQFLKSQIYAYNFFKWGLIGPNNLIMVKEYNRRPTPLIFIVATSNNHGKFQELLDAGADPFVVIRGRSLLNYLCENYRHKYGIDAHQLYVNLFLLCDVILAPLYLKELSSYVNSQLRLMYLYI